MTAAVAASDSSLTATATTHALDTDVGAVENDTLLAVVRLDATATITPPDGWAVIDSDPTDKLWLLGRTVDGTEGTATTFDTSASVTSLVFCLMLTGAYLHEITDAFAADFATGTSTAPDPPSLTPGWGTLDDVVDNLWIAAGISVNTRTWTEPDLYEDSLTLFGVAMVAWRQLSTAVEDPAAFALSSSDTWVTATVAVRPFDGYPIQDEHGGGAGAGIRGPTYDESGPPQADDAVADIFA